MAGFDPVIQEWVAPRGEQASRESARAWPSQDRL